MLCVARCAGAHTLNCFIHPQHRQSWPLLESKSIESKSKDLCPHEERNTFLANSSFLFNMRLQKIPLNSPLSRPVCGGWWMQHRINGKNNTPEAQGLCSIHLQEWPGSAWLGHTLRQGWRKRGMGPDSLWQMLSTADPQRCFSPFKGSCGLHYSSITWVLLNVHPTAVCEVGNVTVLFILLIQRERQTPACG